MSTETPEQRRTRLIEQYVPQLLKLCQGEVMPPADQLINWASRLADAVITATPQPEPTRYPSEIETRLYDTLIQIRELLQTRCYKSALELAESSIKEFASHA